jgi:hypothetical protein
MTRGECTVPKVELILRAEFESKWPNEAAEVDAMVGEFWEPATKDFDAVAEAGKVGNSRIFAVADVRTLLGVIQGEKSKSVERVNIITHANPDLLALGGTVSTSGDVRLKISGGFSAPLDGGIDFNALAGLRSPSFKATLDDVVDRFTGKSAEMVIIACNSGGTAVGDLLLKDIAKTFQVTVKGFAVSVQYCPKYEIKGPPKPVKRVVTRSFTHLDPVQCSKQLKKGFRHLKPTVTMKP